MSGKVCHQFHLLEHPLTMIPLLYLRLLLMISYLEQRLLHRRFEWDFNAHFFDLAPFHFVSVGDVLPTHLASLTDFQVHHSQIFQLKCDYLNIVGASIEKLRSPPDDLSFSDRYLPFYRDFNHLGPLRSSEDAP